MAKIVLKDPGTFGTVNDAVFETPGAQGAGTGVFNTFVQIQRAGTEQGYNTNGAPQFDEKNGHAVNHALLLADIPVVLGDGTSGTQAGVAYREFKLNLNEAPGSKGLLSLDALQIWQEESGSLSNFTVGAGFAGAHTNHLVYNLDAGANSSILLNDGLAPGAGQSDLRVLIPNADFINDAADRYVYLYSAFGGESVDYRADGGVEEWGVGAPTENPLNVVMTAAAPDAAGNIAYTIKVSNFGSAALHGITVSDPTASGVTRFADIVGNNDNVLNAGETWLFKASVHVDLDFTGTGQSVFVNTAKALASDAGPVFASAAVTVAEHPHVTIDEQYAVPFGYAKAAGEVISYDYAVANDGNVKLHDLTLTDPSVGDLAPVTSGGFNTGDVNHDGVLDAGEKWHYTASHTVTQDEIDNGGVVDPTLTIAGTVTATTLEGVTATDHVSIPVVQGPHVTLVNHAAVDGGTADHAGEVIGYTIDVTNDGNMTLTNPVVSDPSVGDLAPVTDGGFNSGDTDADGKLDVGETWHFTASHTVTQAEMDAGGSIGNTASIKTDQLASATASASVAVEQHAALSLVATGTWNDANSDGFADAGETITYTFAVANTGNVTLHDIGVADTGGTVAVSGATIPAMGPGDTDNTSWTGSYTITAADVAAGFFDATAAATADAASVAATAHTLLPHPDWLL